MGKSKKTANDSQPSFDRDQIRQKLEEALADMKPALGDKKFKRRIKKAAKLISSGLTKKSKTPSIKTKKITAAQAGAK